MFSAMDPIEKLMNKPSWLKKGTAKCIEVRQEGNNLYTKQTSNHLKILSLYSQSAALAEKDSEELALAYGNRSALLIRLNKYKECLVDIENALRITKSEKLKLKLLARKDICLSMINVDKSELIENNSSKIRMNTSKHIPCASDFVSLKFDEKYGRHVVANQDINPGTIIAVEKAFVMLPNKIHRYLNCSHCMNCAWNAIPCDSCTTIIFCSKKCKDEAWSQYHDIECLIFSNFDAYGFHDNGLGIVYALRMLIVGVKQNGLKNTIEEVLTLEKKKDIIKIDGFFDKNIFQSHKFKSIYNLSHYDDFNVYEQIVVNYLVELLLKYTTAFDVTIYDDNDTTAANMLPPILKKIITKLIHISNYNAYSVQYTAVYEDIDVSSLKEVNRIINKEGLGIMISPFSSLFNHSCCNNVERIFTPNQEIMLYTTAVVEKGEQLYVNYGPNLYMDKSNRQRYLRQTYNFICACQACNENWERNPYKEKNFDKDLSVKLFIEISLRGLLLRESTRQSIFGPRKQSSFSENTLKDIVEILKVIHKRCTGLSAHLNSYLSASYIINYFWNIYAIKSGSLE